MRRQPAITDTISVKGPNLSCSRCVSFISFCLKEVALLLEKFESMGRARGKLRQSKEMTKFLERTQRRILQWPSHDSQLQLKLHRGCCETELMRAQASQLLEVRRPQRQHWSSLRGQFPNRYVLRHYQDRAGAQSGIHAQLPSNHFSGAGSVRERGVSGRFSAIGPQRI